MKIDFIVYHHLQAQAVSSVFEKLKHIHDCRWKIGPFNERPFGDVAILVDHRCFHNIFKSRAGYKYLFHLSHDMADIDVYSNENLYDFDIIFVPTKAHYEACLDCGYDAKKIKLVGWPKYDNIDNLKLSDVDESLEKKKNSKTLLYAPTFANNYEWKKLFPFFQRLGCQIIIKNHIYVDNGQALPLGQEEEYRTALASVQEMEEVAVTLGFTVLPRVENICRIFPLIDILVSDSSSCLIEFLPFGVAIETGSGPLSDRLRYQPQACLLSNDVLLCPGDKLIQLDVDTFFNYVDVYAQRDENAFISLVDGYSAGAKICEEINSYLKSYQPDIPSWLRRKLLVLRELGKKMLLLIK